MATSTTWPPVDSDQTPPDTDNETVPLVRTPALNVTKDVTSVTGGTANAAGDVIVYSISVQNTGNAGPHGHHGHRPGGGLRRHQRDLRLR